MGIIIKPIVTEKLTVQGEKLNRYGFIVDREANKLQIKAAVEQMYNVTVADVNTVNYHGKRKARYTKAGMLKGRTNHFKKAYVTLAGEDIKTIDLGAKSGLSRVYRIPLIDEVMAVVPKDRILQAEIKGYSKEYPDLFDAAVKKAGLSESNIVVSAFSYDALKDLKARYPKYRTIYLVKLPKDKAFSAEYWIDMCKKAKIDVFCPQSISTVDVMTRADADAIRAAGIDFRVYGVKTRENFRQAAKLGASGFTCDFWDVVFEWAKELGMDYHPVTRR